MLSAQDLRCRRGGRTVLAGLSFDLNPGQVIELRGANGSGKTTLLRVLAGLTPADGGVLHWNASALLSPEHAARTAYLGHLDGLNTELSAVENLRFAQQLGKGAEPEAAFNAWDLSSLAGRPVRFFSQGQRRRLALARVWLAQRTLWLLDEPCAALDSDGEQMFDTRLAEHLQGGGMAVVATHRALSVPAAALQSIDLGSLASFAKTAIAAC